MYNQMKSHVTEFYNGKQEITSLDDQLPVIIYIVLMANIPQIYC